ncbi:alanine racemase [Sutcliffiella horikoshii]|uniref:alanine racemase n=1 Tax=Sutcliffiella horikoshii TaxID=79883 RepID=UPI002040870E|nr:alanine racemase [Sutcliffiella horikoshii]MCM3620016.1 alanine racemase [Sutcliffiella horikoshii]
MSSFHRDTWVEVDLDCIYENVRALQRHVTEGVVVIAVVKANAYGHGDAQVAKVALEAGAKYLAVSFLDEAMSLRKQGITAPILVLGASRVSDLPLAAKEKITLTVFQKEWVEEAVSAYDDAQLETVNLHLKLDTGMGRIGVRTKEEVAHIMKLTEKAPHLQMEGVYTHFATADELQSQYVEQQFKRFDVMLNEITKYYNVPMVHCGNSATTLRFPTRIFNAVRVGIAMYGLTPSPEMEPTLPFPLKEAFSLHTKLVHVKKLSIGESVSYGATYTTKEEEWVGTVPVGYADGWIRKLQGMDVLVDGKPAPIIGRICMDQFMVKLPYELPIGTKVTLIGKQGDKQISSNDVAAKLETINYEVPCMISYRVPRMFWRNKNIIEVRNYLQDKPVE